jgi:putative PIN family toxin of toxin-antitoxin system
MIDTNVLISIFLFSSAKMRSLIDAITEQHTIVLPSYVLDELKGVVKRKFAQKYDLLDRFIQELPFTLAYTPEKIDAKKYPEIQDKKDLPILVTAMLEDVDILITGDTDFAAVKIKRPEILTPTGFLKKYN